jgi:hypothetical protein
MAVDGKFRRQGSAILEAEPEVILASLNIRYKPAAATDAIRKELVDLPAQRESRPYGFDLSLSAVLSATQTLEVPSTMRRVWGWHLQRDPMRILSARYDSPILTPTRETIRLIACSHVDIRCRNCPKGQSCDFSASAIFANLRQLIANSPTHTVGPDYLRDKQVIYIGRCRKCSTFGLPCSATGLYRASMDAAQLTPNCDQKPSMPLPYQQSLADLAPADDFWVS